MKITDSLITAIVHGEPKIWMKVKAWDSNPGYGMAYGSWKEIYEDLEEHHEKETGFLISLVKALAEHIDDFNEESMSNDI